MTQKQKLFVYEMYLHKLSKYQQAKDQDGIKELVRNADRWSYGQTNNDEQQETKRFIDWTFRTLSNTPLTDSKLRKLQREKEKKKRTRLVHSK